MSYHGVISCHIKTQHTLVEATSKTPIYSLVSIDYKALFKALRYFLSWSPLFMSVNVMLHYCVCLYIPAIMQIVHHIFKLASNGVISCQIEMQYTLVDKLWVNPLSIILCASTIKPRSKPWATSHLDYYSTCPSMLMPCVDMVLNCIILLATTLEQLPMHYQSARRIDQYSTLYIISPHLE